MPINRLAHVAFQVRDLDTSLKYYEILGLREKFRLTFADLLPIMDEDARAGRPHDVNERSREFMVQNPEAPWIIYLEIARLQFLEIFPAIEPDAVGDPLASDSAAHLCLEVEDAQATWAELEARGVHADAAPRRGPDNSIQFWLTDPDGHRIEMMQYTARSFQLTGR